MMRRLLVGLFLSIPLGALAFELDAPLQPTTEEFSAIQTEGCGGTLLALDSESVRGFIDKNFKPYAKNLVGWVVPVRTSDTELPVVRPTMHLAVQGRDIYVSQQFQAAYREGSPVSDGVPWLVGDTYLSNWAASDSEGTVSITANLVEQEILGVGADGSAKRFSNPEEAPEEFMETGIATLFAGHATVCQATDVCSRTPVAIALWCLDLDQ